MPEPTSHSPDLKRALAPIGAGLAQTAVYLAVLSIPLEAATQLDLSPSQTSAWVIALYGLPSVIAIALIAVYRQPLMITGNLFVVVFVLLLGRELEWEELVGAAMVAGLVVLVLGLTGLTHRLALLLPAPIVYGLLAGAVLDLIAGMFTALGSTTLIVGSTLVAYFVSRAWLGDRVPAILPALVVGTTVAFLGHGAGALPTAVWPEIALSAPQFTFRGVLTAAPVIIVFMTLQANAPSVVFLRAQGYNPPERVIAVASGLGTTLGSLFGPTGISLSLPASGVVAGPDAGDHDVRHWASLVAAGFGLVIALFAGFASDLTHFIPEGLLSALVGLAVLGVFVFALSEVSRGPLRLGPAIAFAVSVSRIELLGLGRFFWAIVFGLAVSLLLERKGWAAVLTDAEPSLPPGVETGEM